MRAGDLRQRVTLQEPDVSTATGFTEGESVWADVVTAVAGSRGVDAGAASAVGGKRIRIRFRSDVCAGWRVVVGTVAHQVTGGGDPDGKRTELLLLCTEVQ